MAKIEEVHQQREDRDYFPNGEVSASEEDNGSYVSTKDMAQEGHEAMEVDENAASSIGKSEEKQGDNNEETAEESAATAEENVGDDDMVLGNDNGDDEGKQEKVVSSKDDEVVSENAAADINTDEPIDDGHKSSDCEVSVSSKKPDESDVHEISEDDKDVDSVKNIDKINETIELNNSEANDGDEDSDEVIIVDDGSLKKKDPIEKRRCSSELEIIDLDTTPVKTKVKKSTDEGTPNQSARNLIKKTKSYKLDEDDELLRHIHRFLEKLHSGKILAKDPLAFNTDELKVKKDTKPARNTNNSGGRKEEKIRKKNNKKESNFVIIDTNSILSDQRPVPMNEFSASGSSGNSASSNNYAPIFPMVVPVQGMHFPYMRAGATSTSILMTSTPTLTKQATLSSTIASLSPSSSQGNTAVSPAVTANTSMLVVETPSFVEPHLCVQPPVTQFKTFSNDLILEHVREQQKMGKKQKKDGDDDDAMKTDDVKDDDKKMDDKNRDLLGNPKKPVQSNLLKQQKRQLDREGQNANTIQSLMKNLEYSKAKNEQCIMLNTNQRRPMRRGRGRPPTNKGNTMNRKASNIVDKQAMAGGSVLVPINDHLSRNQVTQQQSHKNKLHQQGISMNLLPGPSATPSANMTSTKLGDTNPKKFFLTCEICDFYYIKDLEQLRNHMEWVHKATRHSELIYNCQECLQRFFTDQGLERHFLCSHGLVTNRMYAANKSKNAVKCRLCGFYHQDLLDHLARDHGMTLKPLNLSYKCTVCTAAFGTGKQFENHMNSAHIVVAKRAMGKQVPSAAKSAGDSLMKPNQDQRPDYHNFSTSRDQQQRRR